MGGGRERERDLENTQGTWANSSNNKPKNQKTLKHENKNKKPKTRKSKGTRQTNRRGDGKVESNDSPEIPDRVKTYPRPPLGALDDRGLV